MRPLILITNDDGPETRGVRRLYETAMEFGDVVVMMPDGNASGRSLSLTTKQPVRVRELEHGEGLDVYCCDGTPVDCVKLALEYFCPRQPALVLSGINHGSNSSINVIYSGTMGAVIEASTQGFDAVGFSLLSHSPDADMEPCIPYVRHIVGAVLGQGLPRGVSLNVNIPHLPASEIRGLRICHEAQARWTDSFERRVDPRGRDYWWLTGKFECPTPDVGSDEWALRQGYVSVVPVNSDYTAYQTIGKLSGMEINNSNT